MSTSWSPARMTFDTTTLLSGAASLNDAILSIRPLTLSAVDSLCRRLLSSMNDNHFSIFNLLC